MIKNDIYISHSTQFAYGYYRTEKKTRDSVAYAFNVKNQEQRNNKLRKETKYSFGLEQ